MKKIILGIFVFMSFLSNAQEYKIEDNALTGIFKAQGKTKPQSLQQDLTAMQNRAISPLRLDRDVEVSCEVNSIQSKVDVVFDTNGNQTLYIDYFWNSTTQSLVPSNQGEYTYDANGNQTLFVSYSWNTDTQSFVLNYKGEYTYDANGNLILSILSLWNTTTQSFVLLNKSEFSIDASGNQILQISYNWNTTTQSFVPDRKREWTYDANGNNTLRIDYLWNTTTQSFVLLYKFESSYDANGNNTLYVSYSWNSSTQSFVPSSKFEYTYDANGNQTLYIHYNWTTTQSFVPYSKSENSYDANGNNTLSIRYSWNTTTQSFVPNRKIESTYNNGLPITFLTQKTIYKWYSDLGIYKPSFKTEYSTILDNDTQLHRKGVLYQYDTNFNVWNAFVGDEYNSYEYYTKNALSTETIDNDLISLYPNPTADLLYVSHPELNSLDIQITDLSGRQMYSGAIQKEVPLNVSTYAEGIYLVTVENKETDKKKTYKIIKK